MKEENKFGRMGLILTPFQRFRILLAAAASTDYNGPESMVDKLCSTAASAFLLPVGSLRDACMCRYKRRRRRCRRRTPRLDDMVKLCMVPAIFCHQMNRYVVDDFVRLMWLV